MTQRGLGFGLSTLESLWGYLWALSRHFEEAVMFDTVQKKNNDRNCQVYLILPSCSTARQPYPRPCLAEGLAGHGEAPS